MKKLIYISALFVFVLAACEDALDLAPSAAISSVTYFTNDQQLETGVFAMYDAIQGVNSTSTNDNHSIQYEFYLTEMRSDNTRTKASEGEAAQFESYDIRSTNGIVLDYYRSMYNVIYRANTVLENIDVASDANRAQFEGEARFVRAYAYFNLVRLYGAVPLVDRIIGPQETEVSFGRATEAEIYSLITSDLEMAVDALDNRSVNRATQAGAQALLAKVYMTNGGNYVGAQQLLESIINSGNFSLESDFTDVFYDEANSEVIFSIGYVNDLASDSQNFSAEWLNAVGRTSGVNYVTADAREALDNLGGDRTALSYRQDALQPTQFQVVKYLPNGDTGLGIAPTSTDPTQAGNDWIVIRYADVLLMHVEAIMAGGNDTSVAAALTSFQQVRDRAGLTTAVTSVSKDDLLAERRVELAFENHRWFDLVRFGVASQVLSAFSDANSYSYSATDLLLPIPQAEINLSKGALSQNPGY